MIFTGAILDAMLVLKISDHDYVDLNGAQLHSVNEVAEALNTAIARNPDVTISIETNGFKNYEAIGKAIYGSCRAAISRQGLPILIDGKPVGI